MGNSLFYPSCLEPDRSCLCDKVTQGRRKSSPPHSPPWDPQHGLERLGLPRARQHPLEPLTYPLHAPFPPSLLLISSLLPTSILYKQTPCLNDRMFQYFRSLSCGPCSAGFIKVTLNFSFSITLTFALLPLNGQGIGVWEGAEASDA